MAKELCYADKEKFIELADAIRNKASVSETLSIDEMISTTNNIQLGIFPSGIIDIGKLGETEVTNFATANVKFNNINWGKITIASNVTSSANTKITDTTEIGFTPYHFYLWKATPTATQYYMVGATYDCYNSLYSRKTNYYSSTTAITTSSNTTAWTTQTNGHLYFNSNNIYYRTYYASSGTRYYLGSGDYYWVAVANGDPTV